jgi:hypothetical protein
MQWVTDFVGNIPVAEDLSATTSWLTDFSGSLTVGIRGTTSWATSWSAGLTDLILSATYLGGNHATGLDTISVTIGAVPSAGLLVVHVNTETSTEIYDADVANMSGLSVVWRVRARAIFTSGAEGQLSEEWFAHVPSGASGTITATTSRAFDSATMTVTLVSAPIGYVVFDANGSLPSTALSTGPDISVSVSTDSSQPYLLANVAHEGYSSSDPTVIAPSSLVLLGSEVEPSGAFYEMSYVYGARMTSALSSTLVEFTPGTTYDTLIVDAFAPSDLPPAYEDLIGTTHWVTSFSASLSLVGPIDIAGTMRWATVFLGGLTRHGHPLASGGAFLRLALAAAATTLSAAAADPQLSSADASQSVAAAAAWTTITLSDADITDT